jgi:hypothetical protein
MSESNGEFSQPQSEETERAVLGSVLLDNSLASIVTSELFEEDFYPAIHRNAFAAMKAMHERDATEEINPLSLAEAMRRAGSYVEGVTVTVNNFTHGLPSICADTLVKQYIPTLRQQTALRQLLQAFALVERQIRGGVASSDEVLAEVSAQLEAIKKRASFSAASLRVACMADIEPETVAWLWFPFIPKRKLTIIEGDGGIGKSWLTCAIASAITRGVGLPASDPFTAGSVLFLSAEDGLGDTLRPRLDAVGADVSRIYALAEPLTLDAIGLIKLENEIIKYAPALVVIDPLFAFTGGKVDIHRANEARTITAPLAAIAERQGCAIVAIRHLNKSRGGGNSNNAGLGSIDFHAAARSVLLVGKDPDDESKRALCQTKNNLAAFGESQGYTIKGGQFFWTGTSDLTARRILSFESDVDRRDTRAEAIEFLQDALKDGERPMTELFDEAKQLGLTAHSLRAAKKHLKIISIKKGGEFGGKGAKWVWKMADAQEVDASVDDAQDVEEKGGQHLVVNDANKGSCDNGLTQDVADGLANNLCNASQHLETAKSNGREAHQTTERQVTA